MEEGKRAVAGDVEHPLSLMPPAKWIGLIFDWASAHVSVTHKSNSNMYITVRVLQENLYSCHLAHV